MKQEHAKIDIASKMLNVSTYAVAAGSRAVFLSAIFTISCLVVEAVAVENKAATPVQEAEKMLANPRTEFVFTAAEREKAAAFLKPWANAISNRVVENDLLKGDVTGNDPYFSPVPVSVMRRDVNYLILEMSADTGGRPASAEWFFNLDNPVEKSSYYSLPLITDGQMHRYVLDLRKSGEGDLGRIIYNMRFDPVSPGKAGDKFAVKSIKLVSGFIEPCLPLRIVVPAADSKITLDGNVNTDFWKKAYESGNFQPLNAQGESRRQTKALLCHDSTNLYIGFRAEIDNVSYRAQHNDRDSDVWNDDCIEIFIQPDDAAYYHLVMNPEGGRYDSRVRLVHGCRAETDKSWNGNWRAASKIEPGLWSGTIAIPFADFSPSKSGIPSSWKINICREGKEFSSMNFTSADFHNIKSFSRLEFSGGSRKSPSAIVENWGNLFVGPNQLEVRLSAAGDNSLKCSAMLVNKADLLPQKGTEQPVNAGSDRAVVEYRIPGTGEYDIALSLYDDKYCCFFAEREFTVKDPAELLASLQKELQKTPDFSGVAATIPEDLLKCRGALSARIEQFSKRLAAKESLELSKLNALEKEISSYALDLWLRSLRNEMRNTFKLAEPEYAVGQESTMRKVFKEVHGEAPCFRGKIKEQIEISAAKNETEGMQLVLVPFDKELKDIKITSSSLTAGKEVISSNQIEISIVGFISTKKVKTKYKSVYEGDWPEPLMPNTSVNVPARTAQPVWVNVIVPAGTAAGDYSGCITIAPQNAAAISIPLKLKVWNFELPRTPALRTTLSVNQHYALRYYEALLGRDISGKGFGATLTAGERDKIFDKIYTACLKHKLNVGNIYDSIYYPAPFPLESQWKRLFDQGQNALSIGCLSTGGSFYSDPAAEVVARLKPMVEPCKQSIVKFYNAAKAIGAQDKLYVHAFDELFAYTEVEAKARLLKEIVLEWKKAVPELKVECMTYVLPDLIGAVDIWSPDFGMYEKEPDKFEQRRQAGDELWFYTCLGSPEPGYPPSMVLEAEAIDLRLIPWICKKYKATGFLYYSLVYWNGNLPVNGKCWPQVAWQPTACIGYCGEATFLYPGSTIDDPLISSVRLQNFRDGIEDYDYFAILDKLAQKVESLKLSAEDEKLLKQAKSIVQVREHILKNSSERTADPAIVSAEREKIAELIGRFSKIAANPDGACSCDEDGELDGHVSE